MKINKIRYFSVESVYRISIIAIFLTKKSSYKFMVKEFAWGINKMGHILGAKFALLGPFRGQIINRYRKIIKLNYKSTFIYVFGKILCKKKYKYFIKCPLNICFRICPLISTLSDTES
jgi:hypothetical protein